MKQRNSMHCDDKRTLWVLKENIINCFNELKEKDFEDKNILKKLNDSITEYKELKSEINT
ncbi:MAG TPA: hypothetical protein VLD64_08245 [Nitrosarchaeum sp.]|jgi:hypothetical protein|nr:hypothetical protein [Nitrosarchaeum sp.]